MAAAHIRGLECPPRPAASVHHPSRSTSRKHATVRLTTRSDSTADGSGANRSANDNQGGNIRNHTRRGLLQLATAGSLYAWAGRNAQAADAQVTAAAAAAVAAGGGGSELLQRQLDDRLSQFTLPNGLRFIMYERKAAPIVSFHIYADVGAYDEVDGQTGVDVFSLRRVHRHPAMDWSYHYHHFCSARVLPAGSTQDLPLHCRSGPSAGAHGLQGHTPHWHHRLQVCTAVWYHYHMVGSGFDIKCNAAPAGATV